MFEEKVSGKILFVFSDPGGAKPCLSLASSSSSAVCAISDRLYSFYKDFTCNVLIVDINELEGFIDGYKPDVIFTGTSYTSNIEKLAIDLAKKKDITCYSFVDHWTSISQRFKDDKGALKLPESIWVIDEKAKEQAIQEGISADLLYISGNPYHAWLKSWKPKTTRGEFFKTIKVNPLKKIILFAPDPLSNVNGRDRFGFDEYSASGKIVESVKKSSFDFQERCHVLIKAHPNQNVEKLAMIFEEQINFTMLPAEVDANESIFFSDLVLGFFSSFLIEANILGKPVVRFFEVESKDDPFLEMNLGIRATESNLIEEISTILNIE